MDVSLPEWITYVFDHEVTDPAWHFVLDAPDLKVSPARAAEFISETFENSGDLLRRFSDGQLNQAFWFLVSSGNSEYMFCLSDTLVPMALRQRTLRSFVPLFEQVMAARCTPVLSHLDEPDGSPLNSACYMWWDILPLVPAATAGPENATFADDDVFAVLTELLAIPHDACRESALHGLGHWTFSNAKGVAIIDAFLAREGDLRPELIAYAKAARTGCIL
jgi:hypothetical protein